MQIGGQVRSSIFLEVNESFQATLRGFKGVSGDIIHSEFNFFALSIAQGKVCPVGAGPAAATTARVRSHGGDEDLLNRLRQADGGRGVDIVAQTFHLREHHSAVLANEVDGEFGEGGNLAVVEGSKDILDVGHIVLRIFE